MLALTTVGRRTGTRRITTVAYLRHHDDYAVSAMNLGSDRDPGWCLNLRANPHAVIEVDGERKTVQARETAGGEAEALWRALITRLPRIADFRQLANRDVPIFVLEPRDDESQ